MLLSTFLKGRENNGFSVPSPTHFNDGIVGDSGQDEPEGEHLG